MRMCVMVVLSVIFLNSCGKPMKESKPSMVEQQSDREGNYHLIFTSVNNLPTFNLNGSGQVTLRGDSFEVKVAFDGAPEGLHYQALQDGSSCPKFSDDKNRDGFIDAIEAQSSAGKILIPLDNDLSSISRGGLFLSDSYLYERSTSYQLMMGDFDFEELELENRVIMIYGVPDNYSLPNTIRKFLGQSKHSSLPIACGKLIRMPDDYIAPVFPVRPRATEPMRIPVH